MPRRPSFIAAACAILLPAVAPAAEAQGKAALLVRHVLPIDLALEAARATLARCKADGFDVAVAILDPDGAVRVLAVSPLTTPLAAELAQRKALSAAIFQTSSAAYAERVRANPAFGTAMQAAEPRLAAGRGALPIMAGTEALGAIGVSGAPGGDKDEACAGAGLAAIAAALR